MVFGKTDLQVSNNTSSLRRNSCKTSFRGDQTAGEETWRQLHKNVESNIEQVLATTLHETQSVRPLASHHENYTG